MEQSNRILRTDQKTKIMTYFSLIGFFSLILGIIFNFFEVGYACSLLCWMINGIIESSYNQEELDKTVLLFSTQNFIITTLVGIGISCILIILLFLH
ncbi:MAG: hypothetical protein ACFFAJ_09490 [Candidatus Hodarchaeota archaeon]